MQPTQQDVADLAGVSRQLVSLVVRGDKHVSAAKRRAVQEAMATLGYRPNAAARALVERRTRTIGLVTPGFSNPFFGDLADAIRVAASERNLTPLIGSSASVLEVERSVIDRFIEMGADGLILTGSLLSPEAILKIGELVPVCLLNRPPAKGMVDAVLCDDARGEALATEHAVEAGYKHIVFLEDEDADIPQTSANRRQSGFLAAMKRMGRADEAVTITVTGRVSEAVLQAFDIFNSTDVAFICHNDQIAFEAAVEIMSRGMSLGVDVGVTGYDNTALASFYSLELTSIDQGLARMARGAVQMIESRQRDRKAPGRSEMIEPTLVARRSTRRRLWKK